MKKRTCSCVLSLERRVAAGIAPGSPYICEQCRLNACGALKPRLKPSCFTGSQNCVSYCHPWQ